jgi:hypothetical protein
MHPLSDENRQVVEWQERLKQIAFDQNQQMIALWNETGGLGALPPLPFKVEKPKEKK